MKVVFTDLDGTLLDAHHYSWAPARDAVSRLNQQRVPWVFVTSKTRAEVEDLREEMGNEHPFIVENGGALIIPNGYFPGAIEGSIARAGRTVLEWGTSYPRLVDSLRLASFESNCPVRGFSQWSVEDISRVCDLPVRRARLAKLREYDEPFVILDTDDRNGNRTGEREREELLCSIQGRGLRCVSGGRFLHILGDNDKGRAVGALKLLYERTFGPIESLGLGDSLNDAALFRQVVRPVIVRSKDSEELMRLSPEASVTAEAGPRGWQHAVTEFLMS
jgi:mannosyl-3-phosphoglycerate phosphatase